MFRKAVFGLRLSCLAVALSLAGAEIAGAQEIRFFRIATGGTSGTYFPIATLIASAISSPPGSRACEDGGSCGVPGLLAVAQSTQGSVENVALIQSGTVESGFSQADIAYWAYHGQGLYRDRGPSSRLRAIANLYPESVHVVVRRDGGIARIQDLRGKRVSLGPEESGTVVDARIVLDAYGVGAWEYTASYLQTGPASDLMRKGQLDAFFVVGGHPISAVAQLADDMPIDLLSVDGPEADRLLTDHPFFVPSTIPQGIYTGVPARLTLTVGAQWLVSADVEDDVIYGITRALWHRTTRRLLDGGHPDGRLIRLDTALDGIAIPLHDGAARYYREAGLLK